jgi:hypothetical protein
MSPRHRVQGASEALNIFVGAPTARVRSGDRRTTSMLPSVIWIHSWQNTM